jgi:hypothetical protein
VAGPIRPRSIGSHGHVENLRKAGIRFRDELVTGVSDKQILVEDPSGNPVELFEPLVSQARLDPAGSQRETKILDTSHRIEWGFAAGVDGMRQTLLHSVGCQTDVSQHHCRVDGLQVGTHDRCCRQLG